MISRLIGEKMVGRGGSRKEEFFSLVFLTINDLIFRVTFDREEEKEEKEVFFFLVFVFQAPKYDSYE